MPETTNTLNAQQDQTMARLSGEVICYAFAYPDIECQFCDAKGPEVVVYHQNTQYHDAESNYVSACPDCKERNDEYWAGMWDDYYSNCM